MITKQELIELLQAEGIYNAPVNITWLMEKSRQVIDNLGPLPPHVNPLSLQHEFVATSLILNLIAIDHEIDSFLNADLQILLRARSILTQSSPYDCFSFRASPMTKVIIRIVEKMTPPGTPLLPVFLGQSLHLDYSASGETLQDITERTVDGQRRLNLDGYILSAENNAVIPFGWYSCQTDKTSPNFYQMYTDAQGQRVPLAERDMIHLKNLFGDDSKDLFDQLELYQALSRNGATVYGLFMGLIDGLDQGAVKTNRDLNQFGEADEFTAGPQAMQAIDLFFSAWNSLSPEIKAPLLNLRLYDHEGSSQDPALEEGFESAFPTIREYFLLLRGNLENDDPLIAQEAEIRGKITKLHCVKVISRDLREIVNQRSEQFETSLTGSTLNLVDYEACFSKLQVRIANATAESLHYPHEKKYEAGCAIKKYLALFSHGEVFGNVDSRFTYIQEIYFYIELYGETMAKGILMNSDGFHVERNDLLSQARATRDQYMLGFLVSAGVSLAEPTNRKRSILHLAIENDWLFLTNLLCHRYDIVNLIFKRDYLGFIPLERAIEDGALLHIPFLLNHGAANQITNTNHNKGNTILQDLIDKTNVAVLKIIFDHPSFMDEAIRYYVLNVPLVDNLNPLQYCIEEDYQAQGKLLLEYYQAEDLYHNGEFGVSPLHQVVVLKNNLLLELMVLKLNQAQNTQADKYKDISDNTALHHALVYGDSDTIKLVLKLGMTRNVEPVNHEGLTALQLAVSKNNYPAIKMIVETMMKDFDKVYVRMAINRKVGDRSAMDLISSHTDKTLFSVLTQEGILSDIPHKHLLPEASSPHPKKPKH